jgi:hypothetical protein
LKKTYKPVSRRTVLQAAALLAAPMSGVAAAATPAPPDAYLYIISPLDGQRIRGAFRCRFGLRNMGVTHAGDATPNSGHHHLLIDVNEPLDPDLPIPADNRHIHFGRGQTETELELPPGTHMLQLVLGDAEHRPFNPPVVSRKIRIVVVKGRT